MIQSGDTVRTVIIAILGARIARESERWEYVVTSEGHLAEDVLYEKTSAYVTQICQGPPAEAI